MHDHKRPFTEIVQKYEMITVETSVPSIRFYITVRDRIWSHGIVSVQFNEQ